ncbi:unnamed protein product [Rotaria sordida]|uniref:Uncharacterized protein n=1 Tax=Rotaria sordida TaxID=392033 RepID=A0A815N0P4_9BILA|nr:unnamed protein product [Rotaria sordida]CAF4071119.1 unnamed protein product [Rotaria sordida]
MMNEHIDDDDDDEGVIFDRKTLNLKANKTLNTSNPTPFNPSQINIGVYNESNKLSTDKTILLAITCISMGMFTGLLGPTLPYLAQNMSTKLSSIIWLIVVKGIGFLIGTCLSSYLYTWFNTCCLLGLSCLSISFDVCSLPFITDLTAFYLTTLTLGISLGLSYNGIDALYNCVWTRPSISSIRWLHLLVALGAILSTLMLLSSTFSIDNNISLITQSFYTKTPYIEIKQTTSKSICIKSYCCFYENNRNNTFICQKNNNKNQSNDCKNIFSLCKNLNSNICYTDKNDIWCQIDQICTNEIISNCSIELIDTAINVNNFTTINTTNLLLTSNTTINISTTVSVTNNIQTTVVNTSSTIIPTSASHRNKPSMAESDNDDLSQNFFYVKIRSFIHSITSIDLLYLFISVIFFLLGIFYSILAIQDEKTKNLSSLINLNPLSLLFLQPHRIINNSNKQISLLFDRSLFKFIFFLILFYFILSGIEYSCIYLTYLFGRKFQLSEKKSLLLQFFYLFGRLIDILVNYTWFLLNKHFKIKSDFISIKFLIFIRLIILTVICLSNLFQQIYYLLFFSIGFFLTSLSSLILYWIERDLSLNDLLLRIILFTIIISEIIFPMFIFYKIEYFVQFYLLIGLCLLIIFFMIILYLSKKWQRNRLYRLLPASMELEENSDNEISNN